MPTYYANKSEAFANCGKAEGVVADFLRYQDNLALSIEEHSYKVYPGPIGDYDPPSYTVTDTYVKGLVVKGAGVTITKSLAQEILIHSTDESEKVDAGEAAAKLLASLGPLNLVAMGLDEFNGGR
jgi:hypothetical protein